MLGFGSTSSGSTGNYYGTSGGYNPYANEYANALLKMQSGTNGLNQYRPGGGGNVETPGYAAANSGAGTSNGYATTGGGSGFGGVASYQPLPAYQLYQTNNQAEGYLPSDLQIDPTAMAAAGKTASDQYMANVVNPGVASSISQSNANGAGNSTFAAGAAAALQSNGAAQAQQVNNDAQNQYAQRVEGLRSSYFQGANNTPNTSATYYNQFGLDEQSNNNAAGQLGVAQGNLGVAQGDHGQIK